MELLYVWVEKYGNIKKQGFNFSPNYDFEVKEKEKGEYILVDNFETSGKKKQPENFFGENISNITAIVGKNGSGKSNLIEIIYKLKYLESVSNIKLFAIIKEDENYEKKLIKYEKNISIASYGIESGDLKVIKTVHYANFISNYNAINDFSNENISTDYLLRNARNVESYLLEDLYKQIKFLTENESSLMDGYFDKYIKNLSSINSIVVKINHEKYKKNNLFEKLKSNFEDEMKMVEEEVKSIVHIFCSYIVDKLDSEIQKKLEDETPRTIKEFFKFLKENPIKLKDLESYELEIIEIFLDYKSLSKNILRIDNKEINIKLLKRNEFEIRFKKEGGTSISDEFNIFYKKIKGEKIASIFSFRWSVRLSSGELSLLQMMGRFFSVEVKENQIFLLDEPEITFHPEWQRNMVLFLKDYFSSEKYFLEDIYKKVQIILTSHSPFIASDLPRENVIMLDTDKDGNCIVKKDKDIKTFGANIFDLYTDAFFVESSFGEFAKGKIKEVVKDLTPNKDGKYNSIKEERIKEIEYILNSIGEPLVKNKLQKMYDEYKAFKIKKLSDDEKNKKILEAIKNSGLNEEEFKKYFGDKND